MPAHRLLTACAARRRTTRPRPADERAARAKLALARAAPARGCGERLAVARRRRHDSAGQAADAAGSSALAALAARLPGGSVIVSATNGKTTTAAMASSILERGGIPLVHNQAGANMAGGIASTLLEAAGRTRPLPASSGFSRWTSFGWTGCPQLRPRAIVLGNLFRDQLDRYGELDTIAERWGAAVRNGGRAGARGWCATPTIRSWPTSAASARRCSTSASRTTRSRSRAWRTPPTPSTAAAAGLPTRSTRCISAISATTTVRPAGERDPPPPWSPFRHAGGGALGALPLSTEEGDAG